MSAERGGVLDLTPFCAGHYTRVSIQAPFSRGNYTYATDGRFMVRVARREDAPERADAPHAERVWPEQWPEHFVPLLAIALPDIQKIACDVCAGRGTEHDCPDCTCECPECEGTGAIEEVQLVSVGAAVVNRRYVDLLRSLPGVEVESEPAPHSPLRFRFAGGEGLLMPMAHVNVKPVAQLLPSGDPTGLTRRAGA